MGETSRPLRERVLEHHQNLLNWKKGAFWLTHWFQEHGTDTVRPQFKFKILTSYKDALRRQLAEGLYIMERGDLNKRCEYDSNEICRLAPVISLYEVEKEGRELAAERGMMDERCRDFVNVMSSVLNNKHQNSTPLPNENIFYTRISSVSDKKIKEKILSQWKM